MLNIAFLLYEAELMQLMTMIRNDLPNLTELQIEPLGNIENDAAKTLLQRQNNLKKIILGTSRRNCQLFLDNLLNSNWTIDGNCNLREGENTVLRRKSILEMEYLKNARQR